MPDDLASRPQPDGPTGLAVGPGGIIYWTDPDQARLLRYDGQVSTVECVGGPGDAVTQFKTPRGLMYHSLLGRLFIADSGNDRIQVFDPRTRQLMGVWGQGDPTSELQEAGAPGVLRNPLGLAQDASSNVYVADNGHGRLQKFDLRGDVAPFTGPRDGQPWQPTSVAVARGADGREAVLALDPAAARVRVFSTEGTLQTDIDLTNNGAPIGLAAEDGGAVYVGDGSRGRIQKYRLSPRGGAELIGEAHYHGPIAALALDHRGRLLVLPDTGGPLALKLRGGCATVGHLWGGPFPDPTLAAESWHRLKAIGPRPPAGSELTLFVQRGRTGPAKPPPPWGDPAGAVPVRVEDLAPLQRKAPPTPMEPGVWYRAPGNAPECLFPGTPGEPIWVAVEFSSDGDASPSLSQLRLDFQYERLAAHLPDCYFEDVPNRGLIGRLVALFAGLFEEAEDTIDRLPGPVRPAGRGGRESGGARRSWWGWSRARGSSPGRVREAIGRAFSLHDLRGTTEGLVQALRAELGIRVVVEEPILQARCWVLPGDGPEPSPDGSHGIGSILGVTTTLAAGEPQGAVVGSSLTLDQTQLIGDDEIGLPIFGELAHRLIVRVYEHAGAGPEFLQSVRAVLDREIPCHVDYELCTIRPRMRLGLQARLGVDAVLAGPPTPTPLDAPGTGADLVLGGEPPALLGADSRLGRTTYLGQITPEAPPPED